jgi:UMF1 family MFS transporter
LENHKNNPQVLRAWVMYDWANSVHALAIASAIFPVYYGSITKNIENGNLVNFLGWHIKSSVLFSYTVSASFLTVALLMPLLSAISDYSGQRRLFMRFFVLLGAGATVVLFFLTKDTITLGIFAFGLSLVGYAGSFVFYNAYLPEIATEDRFDSLSGQGYAMGYLGSVLLLLVNLAVILMPRYFGGLSEEMATRVSFLMTGLWWWGFAQYTFWYLPRSSRKLAARKNWLGNGFRELYKVWQELAPQYLLKTFLISFFLYSMGLQTVMYVAAIFGEIELKIPGNNLIIVVMLIQLLAIIGSLGFARLSAEFGNTAVLRGAILMWIVLCFSAYFINQMGFYILACLIGLVMGGTQSLSRSTYSKLIPENTSDRASYYSFYDVSDKLATVLGTFSFGFIEQITGNVRYGIVALALYFALSLLFLLQIPSHRSYKTLAWVSADDSASK